MQSQAVIIDSGSTNTPGLSITLDASGDNVTLEPRDGPKRTVKIAAGQCAQFITDLQAAGPLDKLPANHCMKSASFGSRLYLEFNGVRSPDLSCPVQADSRTANLKKQASDILKAARER
jgi:hypothetical protein